MSPKELFRKFARVTADAMGSAWTFCTAIVVVAVWGFLGPAYDYSDTWQLVINTATTIVTFLMVFVIQNTQNRDAKAIQLKLDELLRGVTGARTGLVHLEELTEEELSRLEREFHALRARASRRPDRPTPDGSEPTEGVQRF